MIMQAEAPKQKERWEIVGQMAKERYRAEEIAEQVGIARSLVYKDKKRYEEETGEALPKPVQKSRFRDPYAEQWEAAQEAKQETETPSSDYEQRFAKLLKKYEAICEDYEQVENDRDQWRQSSEAAQKHVKQLRDKLEQAEQPAQPSNKVQELEAQLEDYRRTRAVWKEDYERVQAENQNLQAQLQECREQTPGEDYKAKYEAVVQALKAHL